MLFPTATVMLCWMDGKSNAADSKSKLTYGNINIINSKLYREGPDHLREDGPDRVLFYKVTKDKEEWIPLPERLIMRAKKQSEKILKARLAETCANNVPKDIERCFMCQDNETCEECSKRKMRAREFKLSFSKV